MNGKSSRTSNDTANRWQWESGAGGYGEWAREIRPDPFDGVGVVGNFGRYPEARIAARPYVVRGVAVATKRGGTAEDFLSSPYQMIWIWTEGFFITSISETEGGSTMKTSELVFHKQRGGQFRWITVSTLMLAIGTILHLVSPSFAGFTPNWTIATYCVAILLTKPTYRQCLGIGLVASLINILTSKSGFPYGNLVSEPLGALTAAVFATYVPAMNIGKISLRPALSGMVATIISGGAFVTIMTFALGIEMNVYLYGMLPAVVLVGLGNAVVTPILYLPAQKLFASRGLLPTTAAEEDSDHSKLDLRPQSDAAIEIDHFSYRYPDTKEDVLHNISLRSGKGEFTVVTGPAAAGKSTLAKALIGAIPHYYGGTMRGMVYIDGMAITQHGIANLASKVGTILADYDAQLVTMTVEEEMAFSLENRGFSAKEIDRRSTEALAKVGLAGMEKRAVASLSGGQRQRLVIASVLATEPDILVFDEPTSALDPDGIRSFYELVGELNRRDGITVVVVEHRLDAVLPYAQRMILMNEGDIVMDAKPEKVLGHMYKTGIHAAAVPEVYAARLAAAEAGFGAVTDYRSAADELTLMARLAKRGA